MKQFFRFALTLIALTLVAPAAMAQGFDIPPPPGGGFKQPKEEPKKEEPKKEEKREYKNPCAAQPGTKWCAVLSKCVAIADFDKECKKEADKADDKNKGKDDDCGELGTVTEANGTTRCKTLKEIIAEVLAEQKSGGPTDLAGNCLYGPFPVEEAAEASTEPVVCYTYEQAMEKGSHTTLFLVLFLLCLGGVGGLGYQNYRQRKEVEETVKAVSDFLVGQPPPKTYPPKT